MARFFGASSPSTIWTTVDEQQHQDHRHRQADRPGDAGRAEQVGEPVTEEGLGDVTDEQRGHGDAELRAGEHERQPAGDRQRPRGGLVALVGEAAQLAPVDGDVAELLRDEVAGERR